MAQAPVFLIKLRSGFCILRARISSTKWLIFLWKNRFFSLVPLVLFYIKNYYQAQELASFEGQIVNLQAETIFLKSRLKSSRLRLDDMDFPVWEKLKDGDRFIMLAVNDVYADSYLKGFGLSKRNYVGHTDFEILDPELAFSYYQEDLKVARTGKKIRVRSRFKDREGVIKEILVIKWRRIDRRDTMVMGLSIDLKELKKVLKNDSVLK